MAKKIAPGEWTVDNPIEGYSYLIHGTISKHGFILTNLVDEKWCEVVVNSFGSGGTFLVKREFLRHLRFKSKIPIADKDKRKSIIDIVKDDNKYIESCINNNSDFHLEEEEIAFLHEIEPNLSISVDALQKNKKRLEHRRYKEELAEEQAMLRAEEEFEIQKAQGLDNITDFSHDNPWKEALGDDEEANDAYWNTE